jgi:hypothetical protein
MIDEDAGGHSLDHRAFGMINESELDAYLLPPVLFSIEPDPPLVSDSSIGNDALYICYNREEDGTIQFSLHGRYF